MDFLERLQQHVLIGDGAIGTMLYAKGVGLDVNFEHLNLVRPELVEELHAEYIAAGAQVIETNTFGANYTKLQAIGLEHKVRGINLAGVQLARRAAQGKDVFVAGSVGPLQKIRGDVSGLTAAEMAGIFGEQCNALRDGGVDLFMLETFADLSQLLIALKEARKTGLPVLASVAFMEGGRTATGSSAEEVAAGLTAAGTDVIGANCGAGPLEVLHTIGRLAAATPLPLAAFANSGFPEYVDGRYLYRATPEYFAARGLEMAAAGARLVGGCCGTTPAHICALAARLGNLPAASRRPASVVVHRPAVPAVPAAAEGFLRHWGKKKLVTVELDPPRGMECDKVLAGSRALKAAGADAINLAENPLARVRMGNIALAHLIQQEVGIEVIVHVTCRDRNLLGLQSELMGASLLGIRSILAVTGDPARMGELAGASSVYDLNSFGLIKLLQGLNNGVNGLGNTIGNGTRFTIGAAFNPNTPQMEVQVDRLRKKVMNGAGFAQTQPLYDPQKFFEMQSLVSPLAIPILPGILPLVSERNCEFLHNEVPGIIIPDHIRLRMRGREKSAGVEEGLAIAKEFITAVYDRADGFYLIPPFGRHEIAVELVGFIKSL